MKRSMGWVAALMLVPLWGCTSAESVAKAGYDFGQVRTTAIVDVEGLQSRAQRGQIADFFEMELLKKGYSVVERSKVEELLKEHKFQASGLTRQDGAAEAGRMLNASTAILISVPRFGYKTEITAKMIDVESAEVVWIGTGRTTTGMWVVTLGGALAGAGAGYALGGDTTGKITGAVLGGLVGGALGHELSPGQAKMARKLIARMALELPSRVLRL